MSTDRSSSRAGPVDDSDGFVGGFRDAFDQSSSSTVVYDPSGRVVALNRAFERLWGARIADVPADYSVLTDPQLEAAGAIPILRRAFGLDGARSPEGAGEAVTLMPLPYEMPSATGGVRTIWTQAHAYPVRDAHGAVQRVVLTHEDITARRMAELKLRESEERYRTLFESIDDGFCVIEVILDDSGLPTDYRFLETNPAFVKQTGLVDAVGRTARELVPDLEQHWIDTYGRVALTGEAVRFENGSEPMGGRWFDVFAFRVGSPDDRRVALLFTDVTGQVRSRKDVERARDRANALQRLTAALAATSTPDEVAEVVVAQGIRATGADVAVLVAREQAFRKVRDGDDEHVFMLRQEGLPTILADPLARFPLSDPGPAAVCLRTGRAFFIESREGMLDTLPEIRDRWEQLGAVALATVPLTVGGQTIAAMSFTWSRERTIPPEEQDFFLALAGQAAQALERARLLAAERAALGAAEMARLAAEKARREADEANQAKSAFLATMSHEIRTPINAQIGYAQLMELGIAGPVTGEQRRYLTRLAATSEHLRSLVDDILDLAKIDAGGMTVASELSHTGALVGAALDLVQPQANAKGVRLVDARRGDKGEPFIGDEHRVRQILANLLSNAVKFTPPAGTVTVTCGMRMDTPDGAQLEGTGPWTFIEVADTGIGIAPEDQARIFEPFLQVDSRHTRQQGGTGLGLAISRRLARLMGGDQTLESTVGVGSTFVLWLPAAPDRRETVADGGARARQGGTSARVHGLAEVGTHLRAHADDVIAAYAGRLRADPAFSKAAFLQRSEIEDHQLTFVVDVAQTLVAIEESGGPESDILRDGSTIQRVVAELHGAMRQRRGWTEQALDREYGILGDEIGAVVRRWAQGDGDVSFALEVLERMIDRARTMGMAALRRAAETYTDTAGPGG